MAPGRGFRKKTNGETHYLRRAVDHEGEVFESDLTRRRDRKAALKLLEKTMKRFGPPYVIATDLLRSYRAAALTEWRQLGAA